MTDLFLPALCRASQLTVGVATTTEVCRAAQQAHALSPVACVALGRLLTASALAHFIQPREGGVSLQVLGEGRLGQLYADVTDTGALRGYVRNPRFVMPLLPSDDAEGRRSVRYAVGAGLLSVMRLGTGGDFQQSTTELASGEIDEDVECFLSTSEQVPTALACEVLEDARGELKAAAGIIVQALPGGDIAHLAALRTRLREGALTRALLQHGADAAAFLGALVPEARRIGEEQRLFWQCRCSHERVLAALATLDAVELADMVQKRERPTLTCDFCGKQYVVAESEVAAVYERRLHEAT